MGHVEVLLHSFPLPWEDISLASWMKYPNPARPDVLGLDVLDRHFDHDTGVLTSYRVSLIKGMMPSWVCAITGGCLCLFLEKSIVDPRKRYMQLVSKNITCNQFLELEEICTYSPDPANADHTLFRQDMRITAYVWGAAAQIERMGTENFKKNAVGGRTIMTDTVDLIPAALSGLFDPKTRTKQ